MFSKVSTRSFATSLPRAVKVSSTASTVSPVSTLKVIVKNAGSKTGPSGLPHLLAASNFLSTTSKSGLRLKREAELLGGEYSSTITRDSIILQATFLKENLPYFVNALGSVLSETPYKPHELKEIVLPHVFAVSSAAQAAPVKALDELHAISFRKGLGFPLYYDGSKPYTSSDIASFAKASFTSENVEVVGENIIESDLQNFVKQSAFASLPESGAAAVAAEQKSYTGVESRIRKAGPTTAVIGVPVKSSDSASYSLLSAYLSTALEAPYTATLETKVVKYDSASLFYVSVTSENPAEVSSLISEAAKLIKSGSDLSAYKALAAYQSGSAVTSASTTVSVPAINLVVVGDVDAVPFADEL